ncbi:signal peptidase II [Reinekea marinisedimentorum]|uniref:Lipoprotein signal peptidase n=1 Tax=Reinekea marinisedimentorum TaxID=230495 RepID=A0A4R3IB97_9GAMM|nr:signal peptidase II [Reinekea marinisedimentorum]TCS43880.1 signal peptidase II [Reinekea marinisedimentorum]
MNKPMLKTRLKYIAPIVLVGIFLDQLTKVWAVSALKGGPRYSFLADTLRIAYAENIGAFLGLGNNLPPQLRFWIFTALVGLFLMGLLVYLFIGKDVDTISLVALSLVFAGGFSNFIDRAMNEGAVVDFLNVGFGGLRTGIFNVADMYIMAGAALIIAGHWFVSKKSN